MKIIVAPDSFKGSLSAKEICDIVEKAALEVFPESEIVKLPVADGGEGTVESILGALQGRRIEVKVKNPLGKEILAHYGIFHGNKAIIEMAAASGLPLIPVSERSIMTSNTYGTGEMVLDAVEKGCETIYMGIGGSATNDGGMGFASALGVRFLDNAGDVLEPIPQYFEQIADIDMSQVPEEIKQTHFVILSDVKNPLLGESGAAYVFGRQKGATEEELICLESGLAHYIQIIEQKLERKIANVPGAGAAGGLGAALLAFTDAKMQSGVETILNILSFRKKLQDAELAVTGEGRMDSQSAEGKVASGIGKICLEENVPCVAIVGGLGAGSELMFSQGISSMMTTVDGVMDLQQAIDKAPELCLNAARRLFRFVEVGRKL